MKNSGGLVEVYGLLNEVSLHDVRLESNSMYGVAQQTNLEYLLMLDVDRLVWSFMKTAGLEIRGKPYGGWEKPEMEVRGHFVGHYLSATAQMWASTYNDSLGEKMYAVVSALNECQEKMGTGYLSAFPSEQFDRVEAIQPVWAPYYTIHKIMAGLLDQYTLAGNPKSLNMTTWMVDYFYDRVQNVITKYTIQRHWDSLNEEFGGMNDVLYRLYRITADDISNFHANTHIPIVIGSQLRYEITGDPISKFFVSPLLFDTNLSRSDPKRLASKLSKETGESCTTYNMLKNETSAPSTLNLRIPSWTDSSSAKASLNGENLSLPPPGNFLSITKGWGSGEKINMELPMNLRTEAIKGKLVEFDEPKKLINKENSLFGMLVKEYWARTEK
uniref:Uncharacterized protein n=1 Tax=Solanum tuberosum TaxID=4113 RepID=M1B7U7_SOLTU